VNDIKNKDIVNRVLHGDCLEISNEIETASVDLILTDLPYGTVENIGNSKNINHGMKNKTSWDIAIEPTKVFEIANRILRKNGKMVLFSQEPYTTRLINEAHSNVPFNYRMIWEKDHFANSLIAKKAPVIFYEDILVFAKKYDQDGIHPLRHYFKSVMDYIGLNLKQINAKLGHRRAEHTFYINSTQYGLCTEKTYIELVDMFKIDEMEGFKTYTELLQMDSPSTFNLWEGKKYKSNIFKYKKDYDGFHPTQKPVLLLEDLIKTFSNDSDTVVDLTAGSCSTAVACINTNRNFICIEQDWEYCNIANERIKKARKVNFI
jgi:site-specific DNA-methyltransferase (adenine-specific)